MTGSLTPHGELIAKLRHVLKAIEEISGNGYYPRLLLAENGGDGVLPIHDAIHVLETFPVSEKIATEVVKPPWGDVQVIEEEARELAVRWQDIHTEESYGPQGKNLGILARSLLKFPVRMSQEAYEEFCGYRAECMLRKPSPPSAIETPTTREKWILAFIKTCAGPAFQREDVRREAEAIMAGDGVYSKEAGRDRI